MSNPKPDDLLSSWWESNEEPPKELVSLILDLGKRALSYRARTYGQPITEQIIEETAQNVWLALIARRQDSVAETPTFHDLIRLVRRKATSIQREAARSYLQNVPQDLVAEPIDAHGEDGIQDVIVSSGQEPLQTQKIDALQRLRGRFADHSPDKGQKRSKSRYNRRNNPEHQANVRTLCRLTGWFQQDIANYLGVNVNRLRDCYYRGYPLPPKASARLEEGIHLAQRRTEGWDWQQLLKAGSEETGKNPVAFRYYLASILGVSDRTLRRWINGEHVHGSLRGLNLALAVRAKGWKR